MAVTKKQQVNIVHHCDSHLCSRPFLEASLSAFVSSAILSSMALPLSNQITLDWANETSLWYATKVDSIEHRIMDLK